MTEKSTVLPTSGAIKNVHHRVGEGEAHKLRVCVCEGERTCAQHMRWLMNCMSNKLSTGLFVALLAFGLKKKTISRPNVFPLNW